MKQPIVDRIGVFALAVGMLSGSSCKSEGSDKTAAPPSSPSGSAAGSASPTPTAPSESASRPKRDPAVDSFAKMNFTYRGMPAKAWAFLPDISENEGFANSKPNLFLWDTGTKPPSEKPDAARLFTATPDATEVRLSIATNAQVQGGDLLGIGILFPKMTKVDFASTKKFKAGTMPSEVNMTFTKGKEFQLFGEVIITALDVPSGTIEFTFAGRAKAGNDEPVAIENGIVSIRYTGK